MIDGRIKHLARIRLRVAFEDRDNIVARDREQIIFDFARKGGLVSGASIKTVAERYQMEIKIRFEVAWATLLNVLNHIGLTTADGLSDSVVSFLEPLLHTEAEKIWASMKNGPPFKSSTELPVSRTAGIDANYNRTVENAFLKLKSDAELLEAKERRARPAMEPSGGGTISVTGDQNVIITGSLTRSQVSVSVDPLAMSQITEALDQLTEALNDVRDDERLSIDELREMISDCRAEIGKDKPNQTKLQSLLVGIATTIQTSAALRPAYETLRAALACFDVILP